MYLRNTTAEQILLYKYETNIAIKIPNRIAQRDVNYEEVVLSLQCSLVCYDNLKICASGRQCLGKPSVFIISFLWNTRNLK